MIKELRKNNSMLEEALKRREQWLKEKPEFRELQDKIDEELKKAGKSPQNRMAVLHRLMRDSLNSMNKTFAEIQKDTKQFQSIINDFVKKD